jgi:hypothetical protein
MVGVSIEACGQVKSVVEQGQNESFLEQRQSPLRSRQFKNAWPRAGCAAGICQLQGLLANRIIVSYNSFFREDLFRDSPFLLHICAAKLSAIHATPLPNTRNTSPVGTPKYLVTRRAKASDVSIPICSIGRCDRREGTLAESQWQSSEKNSS